MPKLRVTKVKGKYTLELRHQLHIQRHFTAKGNVLSYANAAETAVSGALVFLENVARDDLPELPGETTSALHDERFHYLQRLIGCFEILSVEKQFLCLSYDDASKRGISFLGSALHGSLPDGSPYYEVMRVSRLLKDNEAETTKGGLNGARELIKGLEDFAGGSVALVLRRLYVVLVDTTASNTGTLIRTGKGGSASHLRARIEELTRGPNGEQGHVLMEQRDCLSHAGHNECETGMTAMGYCEEDRDYLFTVKDIDEDKGSKKRVWSKNLLDELSTYVHDHPDLVRFIETEEGLTKALGKPSTGSKERWGGYGITAKWFQFAEGRVELIARYAISKEKRRVVEEYEGIAEADLTPYQQIEKIKHAGVRAMLHELNNPEKRVKLIILAWYFEETLGPLLDFTQTSKQRRLRCKANPCSQP